MAAKKRSRGRWLYQNRARVVEVCNSYGDRTIYAHVLIPDHNTPYSSQVKTRRFSLSKPAWDWINELADEWAKKENVEWL